MIGIENDYFSSICIIPANYSFTILAKLTDNSLCYVGSKLIERFQGYGIEESSYRTRHLFFPSNNGSKSSTKESRDFIYVEVIRSPSRVHRTKLLSK